MVGRTCGRFFLINKKQSRKSGPRHIEIHSIRTVESCDRTVWNHRPGALSRRRVVRCDLGLARLVDIAEAEQLGSFCTHIPYLQHSLAQLLLNIEIEILRVGSPEVRIV